MAELAFPPHFEWECQKNTRDSIPFSRDQNMNKCSHLTCMQHALVAGFEAKVNLDKRLNRTTGYHFSAHNLVFGSGRLLCQSYNMDPHRGLDFHYGLRALYLYGVQTKLNNKEVDCPVRFWALETLYSERDEFNPMIRDRAWHNVMTYLLRFGPPVATMKHFKDYDSFNHVDGIYTAIAPEDPEDPQYHCILLVGYNVPRKYFTYLNSWGAQFGNNGCGFVNFNSIVEVFGLACEGDPQRFQGTKMIYGSDPLPPPRIPKPKPALPPPEQKKH